MPDDGQTARQITAGLQYIKDRYGPAADVPPEETTVTCTGGVQIPTIGAGDGE